MGKTRAEIIKERGNPVEDEKQLGKFDEVIAYGKDFLNYELFYFKKDICIRHNVILPKEKFDEKYTELKKQFGEPIKKSDYFLFANEMIKLTTVNPDKLNKIAPNSASKQDSLEYTFMIIYGDKK